MLSPGWFWFIYNVTCLMEGWFGVLSVFGSMPVIKVSPFIGCWHSNIYTYILGHATIMLLDVHYLY